MSHHHTWLLIVVVVFETESHYEALASRKLTVQAQVGLELI